MARFVQTRESFDEMFPPGVGIDHDRFEALEVLANDRFKDHTILGKRPNPTELTRNVNSNFYLLDDAKGFSLDRAFAKLKNAARATNKTPVMALEAHGNSNGIYLPNTRTKTKEVFLLQHLEKIARSAGFLQNELILVMASCNSAAWSNSRISDIPLMLAPSLVPSFSVKPKEASYFFRNVFVRDSKVFTGSAIFRGRLPQEKPFFDVVHTPSSIKSKWVQTDKKDFPGSTLNSINLNLLGLNKKAITPLSAAIQESNSLYQNATSVSYILGMGILDLEDRFRSKEESLYTGLGLSFGLIGASLTGRLVAKTTGSVSLNVYDYLPGVNLPRPIPKRSFKYISVRSDWLTTSNLTNLNIPLPDFPPEAPPLPRGVPRPIPHGVTFYNYPGFRLSSLLNEEPVYPGKPKYKYTRGIGYLPPMPLPMPDVPPIPDPGNRLDDLKFSLGRNLKPWAFENGSSLFDNLSGPKYNPPPVAPRAPEITLVPSTPKPKPPTIIMESKPRPPVISMDNKPPGITVVITMDSPEPVGTVIEEPNPKSKIRVVLSPRYTPESRTRRRDRLGSPKGTPSTQATQEALAGHPRGFKQLSRVGLIAAGLTITGLGIYALAKSISGINLNESNRQFNTGSGIGLPSASSTISAANPKTSPQADLRSLSSGISLQVTKIVDADTLQVAQLGTVRILGIDTPETDHGNFWDNLWVTLTGDNQYAWGKKSTDRLRQLAPVGSTVRVTPFGKDTYGRTLAAVGANGVDVASTLAREGYAIPFGWDLPPGLAANIQKAALQAQAEGIGVYNLKDGLDTYPDYFKNKKGLKQFPRGPISNKVYQDNFNLGSFALAPTFVNSQIPAYKIGFNVSPRAQRLAEDLGVIKQFEESTGLATYMYMALHSRFSNKPFNIGNLTPEQNRDLLASAEFDKLVKTRTWGNMWLIRQEGTRGLLDSGLVKLSRKLDKYFGTVGLQQTDANGEPISSGLAHWSLLGAYDNVTNLILNTANYAWLTIPSLKIGSAVANKIASVNQSLAGKTGILGRIGKFTWGTQYVMRRAAAHQAYNIINSTGLVFRTIDSLTGSDKGTKLQERLLGVFSKDPIGIKDQGAFGKSTRIGAGREVPMPESFNARLLASYEAIQGFTAKIPILSSLSEKGFIGGFFKVFGWDHFAEVNRARIGVLRGTYRDKFNTSGSVLKSVVHTGLNTTQDAVNTVWVGMKRLGMLFTGSDEFIRASQYDQKIARLREQSNPIAARRYERLSHVKTAGLQSYIHPEGARGFSSGNLRKVALIGIPLLIANTIMGQLGSLGRASTFAQQQQMSRYERLANGFGGFNSQANITRPELNQEIGISPWLTNPFSYGFGANGFTKTLDMLIAPFALPLALGSYITQLGYNWLTSRSISGMSSNNQMVSEQGALTDAAARLSALQASSPAASDLMYIHANLGLGSQHVDKTGKLITSLALQGSVADTLFTPTMAMSFVRDKAMISFSLQGPVQLPAGFTLTAPIAFQKRKRLIGDKSESKWFTFQKTGNQAVDALGQFTFGAANFIATGAAKLASTSLRVSGYLSLGLLDVPALNQAADQIDILNKDYEFGAWVYGSTGDNLLRAGYYYGGLLGLGLGTKKVVKYTASKLLDRYGHKILNKLGDPLIANALGPDKNIGSRLTRAIADGTRDTLGYQAIKLVERSAVTIAKFGVLPLVVMTKVPYAFLKTVVNIPMGVMALKQNQVRHIGSDELMTFWERLKASTVNAFYVGKSNWGEQVTKTIRDAKQDFYIPDDQIDNVFKYKFKGYLEPMNKLSGVMSKAKANISPKLGKIGLAALGVAVGAELLLSVADPTFRTKVYNKVYNLNFAGGYYVSGLAKILTRRGEPINPDPSGLQDFAAMPGFGTGTKSVARTDQGYGVFANILDSFKSVFSGFYWQTVQNYIGNSSGGLTTIRVGEDEVLIGGAYWQTRMLGSPFVGTIAKKLTGTKDTPTERLTQEIPIRLLTNNWIGSRVSLRDSGDPLRPKSGTIRKLWHHSAPNQSRAVNLAIGQRQALTNWVLSTDPADATSYFFTRATHDGKGSRVILDFSSIGKIAHRGPLGLDVRNMTIGNALKALGLDQHMTNLLSSTGEISAEEAVDADVFNNNSVKRLGMTPHEMQNYLSQSFYGSMIGLSMVSLAVFIPYMVMKEYMIKAVMSKDASDPNKAFSMTSRMQDFTIRSVKQTVPKVSYAAVSPGPEGPFKIYDSNSTSKYIRYLIQVTDPNSGVSTVYGFGNQAFEYAQPLKGLFNLRSNIDHTFFVRAYQAASKLNSYVGGPGVKTVHNSIDAHLAGGLNNQDLQAVQTTRNIHDMLEARRAIGSNLSNFVVSARAEKIRLEIEMANLRQDIDMLNNTSPGSSHIARKALQLEELNKHVLKVDQAIQASNVRLNMLQDLDAKVTVTDINGNRVQVTLGELLDASSRFKGGVQKGFMAQLRNKFGYKDHTKSLVTAALTEEVSIGNVKLHMHQVLKAVAEDSYNLLGAFNMESISKFGYNPANPGSIRSDLLGPGLKQLFSQSVKQQGILAFSPTNIRSTVKTWWSSARAKVWMLGVYESIAEGISGRSANNQLRAVEKLRSEVLTSLEELMFKYTGSSGSVIRDFAEFRASYLSTNASELASLSHREQEQKILEAFENRLKTDVKASVTSGQMGSFEEDMAGRTKTALDSLSDKAVKAELSAQLRERWTGRLTAGSRFVTGSLGILSIIGGVASLLAPSMDVSVMRMSSASQLEKEAAANAFIPDVVKSTATLGLTGVSVLALSAGAGALLAARESGIGISSLLRSAPKTVYTSGIQKLASIKNLAKPGKYLQIGTKAVMVARSVIAAGLAGAAALGLSGTAASLAVGLGTMAVAGLVYAAMNTDTAKRFFDKFSMPNLSKSIANSFLGAIIDPTGTLEIALSNYVETNVMTPPKQGESGLVTGLRSTYNFILSSFNPVNDLTRPEIFAGRSNFGSLSLTNKIMSRSPIWYGNMYDLLQDRVRNQEAMVKGSAHQFLQQWLHPYNKGSDQYDSTYSDFGDPGSVMDNYRPSKLTGIAADQQLVNRAFYSQNVLTYLQTRHDNWEIQNNQDKASQTSYRPQTSYSGFGPKNLIESGSVNIYRIDEFAPMGSLFSNQVGVKLSSGPAGNSSSYRPVTPNSLNNVTRWTSLVNEAAKEFNVDPIIMLTIMQKESGGNPNARSWVGAQGLMQVMPFHFKPGENGYDPRTNLRVAARYLAGAKAAGATNMFEVAVYYNGGAGALNEWKRTGTFRYSTDRNSRYQQTLPYARSMANQYNNMARQLTQQRLEAQQAPAVQAEHIPVNSQGQSLDNSNVPVMSAFTTASLQATRAGFNHRLEHNCFLFSEALLKSKGLAGSDSRQAREMANVRGQSLNNLQAMINQGQLQPGSVIWMNNNPSSFSSSGARHRFNRSLDFEIYKHHWIVYLGNNQWVDNVSIKGGSGTFTTEQMIQAYNRNGRVIYKIFLPTTTSGKPVRLQPIILPAGDNHIAPTVNPSGVSVSANGIVAPVYNHGEQNLSLVDNRTGSWDITNPRPDNHFWGRY